MQLTQYTILLQNLLNRSVELYLAKNPNPKEINFNEISQNLEELKDIIRTNLRNFKE